MFSAFIKAVGYLVGTDEGEGQDQMGDEGDEQTLQHKEFTGTVTGVYGSYGLIDDEIYFAEGDFDGEIPKEGAKVNVLAIREHEAAGWRTKKVTLLQHQENWDDDLDEKGAQGLMCSDDLSSNISECVSEESLVGLVTNTNEDTVIINNTITCDKTCLMNDFIPCQGDSVLAEIHKNETTGEITVKKLKPLREFEFEGEVNYVGAGYGYINSDIYFTLNTCEQNYVPSRGDKVSGTAIECNKGKSSWRATFVSEIHVNVRNLQEVIERTSQNSLSNQATKELFISKNGITITEILDFGSMSAGHISSITISIRNTGTESQFLNTCKFCSSMKSQFFLSQPQVLPSQMPGYSTSYDRAKVLILDKVIEPGKLILLKVHCSAEHLGAEQQILVFEFQGFKIGRKVVVSVIDPIQSQLAQTAPYERQKGFGKYKAYQRSTAADGESFLIPGQRMARDKPRIPLPNKLKAYAVQTKLEDCVLQGKDLITAVPCLGEELDATNYATRFQALLHIEEIQQQINIRSFDLYRVCLRPFAGYLALKVPGLAEGRPSVLLGDSVILSVPDAAVTSPEYEGYVHDVLRDELLLKFSENMHQQYNGEDYNVRFTFNRTPIRRCHQAAEHAAKLNKEILFPDQLIPKIPQTKLRQRAISKKVEGKLEKVAPITGRRKCPLGTRQHSQQVKNKSIILFNKKLNDRQTAAVKRISNGQSRPTPYILFGPPGTGKTVTTVEAILQVFTNVSSSRILICAPSNSAADLLTERLHESGQVKSADMTRFNAFNRAFDSAPESVRQYCQNGSEIENVVRHRIIVCTCSTAGSFYSLNLRDGHFTHVFVDEAGQATEPECMIPLGLIAGNDEGQIVLAGDPMQLGPVLQSNWSKLFGLEQSLLERLSHRELYQRDPIKFGDHGSYDPLLVTKLVENYRSHSVLIEVSSRLFYHDELVVSAEKSVIEGLSHWDKLPNPMNCPLIFHGIRGEDLREGNSPSWFNAVEAVQVMKYLQAVTSNTVHPVDFDDIGIITPYKKQVEKIRLLIDKLGMEKVKVGSVEEFQGQERPVMIISTVRSTERETEVDVKHNLGFLSNPKRFNVAVTRAQALLIVVGNPHVLSQDQNWLCFIKHCIKNKAYIGCELPDVCLPVTVDKENTTQIMEQENVQQIQKAKKYGNKDSSNTITETEHVAEVEENILKVNTADKITERTGSMMLKEHESKENRTVENNEESSKSEIISDMLVASPQVKEEHQTQLEGNLNVNQSHTREEENGEGTESNSDSEEDVDISNISNISNMESVTNSPSLPTQVATSNERSRMNQSNDTTIKTNFHKEGEGHSKANIENKGIPQSQEQTAQEIGTQKVIGESYLSEQSLVKCEIVPRDKGKAQDDVPVGVVFPEIQTESTTVEYGVKKIEHLDLSETNENDENNEKDDMDGCKMLPKLVSVSESKLLHSDICRPKENYHQNVPLSKESSDEVIIISSSEEEIIISSSEEDEESDDCEPQYTLTELEKKIIRQVEYYFGDYNIVFDRFLLTEMHKSGGWISLPLLGTFKKLKELTDNPSVIAQAINKSSSGLLEVSVDQKLIRRVKLLPGDQKTWQWDVDTRTVCIEGIPINDRKKFEMIQSLEVYLHEYGVTEYIGIVWKDPKQKWPRQQGGSKLIFTVVFKKYNDAKAFVEAQDAQLEGHKMTKYFKRYLNGRLRANKRQYPWLFNMNKLVEEMEAGETENRPRPQRRKQRGETRTKSFSKDTQEADTGVKSNKVVDIDRLMTVTFEKKSPNAKGEQSRDHLDKRPSPTEQLNSKQNDENYLDTSELADFNDSAITITETKLTPRPGTISVGRGVQCVSTMPDLRQFSVGRIAAASPSPQQDTYNNGTPSQMIQSDTRKEDVAHFNEDQSLNESSFLKYSLLEQTDSDVIIESSSEEED